MVKRKYIPDRGDLIWINFNPTLGHEQKGKRPAIVLSPKIYNEKAGLALVCPITSAIKNYPYEVLVGKRGVVLADQIKAIAWRERKAKFIASVPEKILSEVFDKIKTLLEI